MMAGWLVFGGVVGGWCGLEVTCRELGEDEEEGGSGLRQLGLSKWRGGGSARVKWYELT
jgi:hypothetical protein